MNGHVRFTSNSSNSSTSALDTLIDQVGVCRDFAHLMIELCRAMNIPPRYATGTDYGSDPALGPPDFQSYVEVYLGDSWYIFDPSDTAIPMGFVRFGAGRDAVDVAFATMFGSVRSHRPTLRALAVENEAQDLVRPHHCAEALSTDKRPDTRAGPLNRPVNAAAFDSLRRVNPMRARRRRLAPSGRVMLRTLPRVNAATGHISWQ